MCGGASGFRGLFGWAVERLQHTAPLQQTDASYGGTTKAASWIQYKFTLCLSLQVNKATAIPFSMTMHQPTARAVGMLSSVTANDATLINTAPFDHFAIKLIQPFWYHFWWKYWTHKELIHFRQEKLWQQKPLNRPFWAACFWAGLRGVNKNTNMLSNVLTDIKHYKQC